MPELSPEGTTTDVGTTSEPERGGGPVADVAWTLGLFLVLGLIAAVLWSTVAKPPYFVRTSTTAVMGQAELGQRIPVDGIFVLIGLVGSAVLGFALMAWRRRDPLLVLVVGVAASVGAGFVALKLGESLGHRDVRALVEQAALGARVRDTLSVITTWVVVAWPLGFLIAAVSSLLGSSAPGARASYDEGDERGYPVGPEGPGAPA